MQVWCCEATAGSQQAAAQPAASERCTGVQQSVALAATATALLMLGRADGPAGPAAYWSAVLGPATRAGQKAPLEYAGRSAGQRSLCYWALQAQGGGPEKSG